MSENFQTRQTLLYKLRARHDEAAWEDFVRYYEDYIRMVLCRSGLNQEDIKDVSQRVLLSAWQSLPDFDYEPEKGKFRSWLATVIRNKGNTFLYKKMRGFEKESRLAESQQQVDHQLPAIDNIAEQEWKNYISRMAWDNISPSFNSDMLEIFQLSLSGKSNRSIASDRDMKENTIAVYKKRVRLALHKEIVRLDAELG